MTNKESWRKRMHERSARMLKKEMGILQDKDKFVPEKYLEQASKVMSDKDCDRKLERIFGVIR